MDSFSVDVPVGFIARVQFAPVDASGAPANLAGPVSAFLMSGDPTTTTAVDPATGLIVDIEFSDVVGSSTVVDVTGLATAGDPTSTLTTEITLNRIPATSGGVAVTLGADVNSVTFPTAAQFGQFGTTPALGVSRFSTVGAQQVARQGNRSFGAQQQNQQYRQQQYAGQTAAQAGRPSQQYVGGVGQAAYPPSSAVGGHPNPQNVANLAAVGPGQPGYPGYTPQPGQPGLRAR